MTTLRQVKARLDRLQPPSNTTYTLEDWRQGNHHKLSTAQQQRRAEVWAQVREVLSDFGESLEGFEGDASDNT